MHLIEITGFPRSGTSWLFYQLQRLPRVAYFPEEEGLSCWWALQYETADYSDGFRDLFAVGGQPSSLVKLLITAGIFAWKHAAVDPAGFLDRLCDSPADAQYYLHKAPQMVLRPGWPADYVAGSRRFNGCTVLCCRRDPDETYESGLRKFPHWKHQFTRQEFDQLWTAYYAAAAGLDWTIVEHADLAQDPQGTLDAICDRHFAGVRIQAAPFVQYRPPTWRCWAGVSDKR